MTTGSIVSLSGAETDKRKINFAIQQLLQRNGGQQVNSVRSITTADTATASDFLILVSGTTTITLPAASAAPGQIYAIKKTDASNTATIGATVDGTVNPTLTAQYAVWIVESDGTSWHALLKYVAPVSITGLLLNTNNLSDVSSTTTARSNLGLGTAAVLNVGTGASQIVQRDASGNYPTGDGSAITNITAVGRLIAGTPLVLDPYTTSSSTTQAHGLGAVPVYVLWIWECLTANLNYNIGDIIIGGDGYIAASTRLVIDATNLLLVTNNVAPLFTNKTTFSATTITTADWKLTLTPYKLT